MTTAADPKIYPAPREDRGGEDDVTDSGDFQHPRTRLFPFIMTLTANNRRTLSTPRIQGPAIIKGIFLAQPFGQDPPGGSIEIGTARAPVTETAVALATARPYTVLSELLNPFAVMVGASGQGLLPTSLGTIMRHQETPLDLIVPDAEFFAVIAYVNNSVGAGTFAGHLRVLEGVDPDALRFFL
jgi:hypothetical protein